MLVLVTTIRTSLAATIRIVMLATGILGNTMWRDALLWIAYQTTTRSLEYKKGKD